MTAGAVEFLTKPFDDVLLDAIRHAIGRSHDALLHEAEMQGLRSRYTLLTPREREEMALVVSLAGLVTMATRLGLRTPEKT
jgi:FixJ family two-component response regulator